MGVASEQLAVAGFVQHVCPGVYTLFIKQIKIDQMIADLVRGIAHHNGQLFSAPGDPAQTDGKTVAAHDWKNNAKLAVWKFSLYILCDGVDTGVIALCPGDHSLSNAHHITVV